MIMMMMRATMVMVSNDDDDDDDDVFCSVLLMRIRGALMINVMDNAYS